MRRFVVVVLVVAVTVSLFIVPGHAAYDFIASRMSVYNTGGPYLALNSRYYNASFTELDGDRTFLAVQRDYPATFPVDDQYYSFFRTPESGSNVSLDFVSWAIPGAMYSGNTFAVKGSITDSFGFAIDVGNYSTNVNGLLEVGSSLISLSASASGASGTVSRLNSLFLPTVHMYLYDDDPTQNAPVDDVDITEAVSMSWQYENYGTATTHYQLIVTPHFQLSLTSNITQISFYLYFPNNTIAMPGSFAYASGASICYRSLDFPVLSSDKNDLVIGAGANITAGLQSSLDDLNNKYQDLNNSITSDNAALKNIMESLGKSIEDLQAMLDDALHFTAEIHFNSGHVIYTHRALTGWVADIYQEMIWTRNYIIHLYDFMNGWDPLIQQMAKDMEAILNELLSIEQGVDPGLDDQISDLDNKNEELEKFEQSAIDDANTHITDLSIDTWTMSGGVLSAMGFVATCMTKVFNVSGDAQYIVLFPLFLGLALFVIGLLKHVSPRSPSSRGSNTSSSPADKGAKK